MTNLYEAGYNAAYEEIHTAINSTEHSGGCGACRPCEIMKEVIEVLMLSLHKKLTQDEFYVVAMILAHMNARDKNWRAMATRWWCED